MTQAKRRRLGLDGGPDLESLRKLRDILAKMPVGPEPPTSSQDGSSEPVGSPLVRRSGEGCE
jgi:hypothetical protein